MKTSPATCLEISTMLDAYHDHELDTVERNLVDLHLSTCSNCGAKLEGIRQMVASLQALPELAPGRDLSQDIEKLVAFSSSRRSKILQPRLWGSVSVAAAVALIVIGLKIGFDTMTVKSTLVKGSLPVFTAREVPLRLGQPGQGDLERSKGKSDEATLEIAVLNDNEPGTAAESVGLATNEDGLYALKL